MQTQQPDIKTQLKAIEKATKKITSSRKASREYLEKSGILDFVEKATKEALANSNGAHGK